jgi:hypothetical protein
MKTVFLCGKCDEYKTLDAATEKCPDCGGELEEVGCIKCTSPATRVEEWQEPGPAARMAAANISEPRCGAH